MQMHFLRHATCTLISDNFRLLIDPMLSPAEAMDPIAKEKQWLLVYSSCALATPAVR